MAQGSHTFNRSYNPAYGPAYAPAYSPALQEEVTSFDWTAETNIVALHDPSNFASLNLTGSDVNTIADLSGNGNTLEDNGGTAKLQYSATGFNGRPAIISDDVDSSLRFSAGDDMSAITNQCTLVIIYDFDPTNTFRNFWQKRNAGGSGFQLQNDGSDNQAIRIYSGGVASGVFSPRPANTVNGSPHIMVCTFDNGDFQMYVDNVAQFSPEFDYSSTGTTITPESGQPGAFFQAMNGPIGLHMLTSDVKSTSDIARYYAEAQATFGVA